MKTTIYFNPECSKCATVLDMLKENGEDIDIIEYLATAPGPEELAQLTRQLGIRPFELVRQSEPLYLEKFAGKDYADEEWLRIMHENPVLIQRPIVVKNGKAIIGRPPSLVKEIL